MAKRIAAEHTRRSASRGIIAEDIQSAALEGLVRAAESFDPSRGVPFTAYAHQRVRGAVLDFLREWDHISRHFRATAKALDVDLPLAPLSLDQLAEDAGNQVPDRNACDALLKAEREQVIAHLETSAAVLSQRLRTVLFLYYSEGKKLVEIGASLGVTESRACQMLNEAHTRLRGRVTEDLGGAT